MHSDKRRHGKACWPGLLSAAVRPHDASQALGLLWLGAHGDGHATRVWKGLDWDVMDLLHEKGWIGNPKKFLEKHFRARG